MIEVKMIESKTRVMDTSLGGLASNGGTACVVVPDGSGPRWKIFWGKET